MGIESVGGQGQQVSQQMNVTAMPSPDVAQVQQLAAQVAPLISSMSNLCVQETQRTEEGEKVHETTDAPRLDEAELALIEANCVDLEALIAELQAETDEKQVMVSKERIESLQGQLSAAHKDSMAKLNESLEALADQYKTNQLNEALGWIGIAVAAFAVVATVLTGGGALAIFGAALGLAVAVTNQVLNETGAMDDIVQEISDWVHGLDKNDNISSEMEDAIAQLIVAAVELALAAVSIVCGCKGGGGKGDKKAVILKGIMIGTGTLSALAGVGASVASTITNLNASMAQADVTDAEAILRKLQTLLDEESEDLKQILQSMNDSLASVIELLGSKQDTLNAISMNIGA